MRDTQQGVQAIAMAVGYASLALLWFGLVAGIVLRDGRASDHIRPVTLTAIHQTVTACGLTLAVVHALSQLAVPAGATRMVDVIVPFTHRTKPFAVGLGVLGLALIIAVAGSIAIRSWLGYHRWRIFHGLGYLAFALLTLHAVAAAPAERSPLIRVAVLIIGLATIGCGVWTAGWVARLPYLVSTLFAAPSRRARRVTIHVDTARCARLGFCQHEAPDLFELRSNGRLKHAAAASADQVEAAIRAARSCPTRAIVLSREAAKIVVAEPPSEEPVDPPGGDSAEPADAATPPRRTRAGRHWAADGSAASGSSVPGEE